MRFEAIAVHDDRGDLILYDMYVDGVWHGSRRTLSQALDHQSFIMIARGEPAPQMEATCEPALTGDIKPAQR